MAAYKQNRKNKIGASDYGVLNFSKLILEVSKKEKSWRIFEVHEIAVCLLCTVYIVFSGNWFFFLR